MIQLVFESVQLTLAGAGTGLLLTWWSLDALLTLVPDGLPRLESVRIDPTIVLFTAASRTFLHASRQRPRSLPRPPSTCCHSLGTTRES